MSATTTLIRPFWSRFFPDPWKLGLTLILVWGIPRFILVLGANQTGSYQWVSLIFVSMWITPWLFLSGSGRRQMGLARPDRYRWLLFAVGLGILSCSAMYFLADGLFGNTISNWFVYISNSYSNLPNNLQDSDRLVYFSIYAGISMLFSPVGEELFYRGVIHECFAADWNNKIASLIDSAAFSVTHLAHFGIVYYSGQWKFLAVPAFLWVAMLFAICLLFFYCRWKAGSILGAILAHAGFNLAMIYFIFFFVLA